MGEMFEGDFADTCTGKCPLVSMGGRAQGLACADLGAITPISVRILLVCSSAPVSVDLKMIKSVDTESGVEVERNSHPGIRVTQRKNQNNVSSSFLVCVH